MISKLISMHNKRLFEEALNNKYNERISNRYSDSLFVRYRRGKNLKTFRNTYNNIQECLKLIENLFFEFNVNLKIIKVTSEEIERVLTIFLAKANNIKLTNSQLRFVTKFQEATKTSELKLFREFLKNQNITRISSSKEDNEFLHIKLLFKNVIRNIPLDNAQREFLKLLKKRTQDCSNKEYNYLTSKFNQKSYLNRNKPPDGKKNMKRYNKKSEEQYKKELENRYQEKKHEKSMQNSIVEGRAEFLRQAKILRTHQKACEEKLQEDLIHNCAICSAQREHHVPIEYTTKAFTYQSIEDAVAEVICPIPDTIPAIKTPKADDPIGGIKMEPNTNYNSEKEGEITRATQNPIENNSEPQPTREKDSKISAQKTIKSKESKRKPRFSHRLKTPSERKVKKRNDKQVKRAVKIKTRMKQHDGLNSKQKLLKATKTERKSFNATLRNAVLEFSRIPYESPVLKTDSQVKEEISKLNKEYPLDLHKIPPSYHDLKSKDEFENRV